MNSSSNAKSAAAHYFEAKIVAKEPSVLNAEQLVAAQDAQVQKLIEAEEAVGRAKEILQKRGDEKIAAFMEMMEKSPEVKSLFSVRKGDQNFTEIKVTPRLTTILYEAGLLEYASVMSTHEFHNLFEVYYTFLKGLSWFEKILPNVKSGRPCSFVDIKNESEAFDNDATIAFWFSYLLNEMVKKEKIEIDSLNFEGSVPIFSIMDFLTRTRPKLLFKEQEIAYGGAFVKVELTKTWSGQQLMVSASHLIKYTREDTCSIIRVPHKLPVKGFMINKNDLNFQEASEEDLERFKERGKRYIEYTSSPKYAKYEGEGVRDMGWWGRKYFNCTGRVIVDYPAMTKSDSNYDGYFGKNRYDNDSTCQEIALDKLDEDMLSFACPFVYGYSMSAKKWVEMNIDNMSEINFNSEAFDMLVLEDNIKSLVMSLVSADKVDFKDIIDSKGLGYIFLLSGGPGTGKTLLAEALAETLHRPIYYLGIGELGTDVDSLEARLKNVLEICEGWDAILLIDEIDIFVQKRGPDASIDKNAMTGVFLRLLEYYSGIMFLTTNLAQNLDPAFISRTSLNINFGHHLSAEAREQVWRNLTKGIEIERVDYKLLAGYNLNGRRIKNCLKLLMTLSSYKAVKPTMSQLVEIINLSQNEAETTGYAAASGRE